MSTGQEFLQGSFWEYVLKSVLSLKKAKMETLAENTQFDGKSL